jgi:hypothetical protein
MQIGTYSFMVSNPANSSMLATNSPLAVSVFPALSAADISRLVVSMPTPAVGAVAACSLHVLEANGTPRLSPNGALLAIQGTNESSAVCINTGLKSGSVLVYRHLHRTPCSSPTTCSMWECYQVVNSSVCLLMPIIIEEYFSYTLK